MNNKDNQNTMLDDMVDHVTKKEEEQKAKAESEKPSVETEPVDSYKGEKADIADKKKDNTNKELFNEILDSHLSPDRINQELGNIKDTKWKEDEPKQILTNEDKKKIVAYDKLNVEKLPYDWEKQLQRKEWLETELTKYEQTKKDLAEWTTAFSPKTPTQVGEALKAKEKEHAKDKGELDGWKEIFKDQDAIGVKDNINTLNSKINSLESRLKEWTDTFPEQTASKVKQQIQELQTKLKEWVQTWDNKDLATIKAEWMILKKRPDIPISEKEFWDDYARREKLTDSDTRNKELKNLKEQVGEITKENKGLWKTVNDFLEAGRILKYIISKVIATAEDARQAIAELLIKVKAQWEFALDNIEKENTAEKLTDKNWNRELILSFKDEKKRSRAKQVLIWVDEAMKTFDYQQLFERWSGGKEYNKENDYDGNLYLLEKYLEKEKKAKEESASPIQSSTSSSPSISPSISSPSGKV